MAKRELSEKEKARMVKFDQICQEMETQGYEKRDMTIGIVKANVLALVVMFPFMILLVWFYSLFGSGEPEFAEPSLGIIWLFVFLLFGLVVVHELIHGLTWGSFAKGGFKTIDFGIIWKAMTPYCTCSEPLGKGAYVWGAAMPTIVLGFGLGILASVLQSMFLLVIAEIMIVSGGGDFLILLKMFSYNDAGKEAVYYDHPTECGFVVFEKKKA
jgi:hypothetical protein